MANKLIQTQEQRQQQVQRLSQQQMLQVKLLEMPLTELEESVNAELDDNPALEKAEGEERYEDETDGRDEREEDFAERTEREEREEALDKALENIGRDDEMPDAYGAYHPQDNADYEEIVYGDTKSFYDKLKEQMRTRHILRMQQGHCSIEAGFVLSDLLTDLERTSDHCSNIAGCVIDARAHNLNLHETLRQAKTADGSFQQTYESYVEKYQLPVPSSNV